MQDDDFVVVSLRIKKRDTVGELKQEVSREMESIFFRDRLLKDEDKLDDVGIQKGDKITNERWPLILTNKIRPVLHRIVNNLDPRGFTRFARTCKDLQRFCFKSPQVQIKVGGQKLTEEEKLTTIGRIDDAPKTVEGWDELRRKILDDPEKMEREYDVWMNDYEDCFEDSEDDESDVEGINRWKTTITERTEFYRGGFSIDKDRKIPLDIFQKATKAPFFFAIERLNIDEDIEVNSNLLVEMENLFRRCTINRVDLELGTTDWDGFYKFTKECKVTWLDIGGQDVDLPPIPVPILQHFLKNLDRFCCYERVPDELILSSSVSRLELRHARISAETFKELIKKYEGGDMGYWMIGREPRIPGVEDSFEEVWKTVRKKEFGIDIYENCIQFGWRW